MDLEDAFASLSRSRTLCRCQPNMGTAPNMLVRLGKEPSEGQLREVLLPAIKESPESLQSILKYFASEAATGAIFTSLDILQQECAHDGNIKLDARDYTIGISSCARSKLWQHACWLFAAMPRAQVQPNIFSYSVAYKCEFAVYIYICLV